jgi:hypothetical protein
MEGVVERWVEVNNPQGRWESASNVCFFPARVDLGRRRHDLQRAQCVSTVRAQKCGCEDKCDSKELSINVEAMEVKVGRIEKGGEMDWRYCLQLTLFLRPPVKV